MCRYVIKNWNSLNSDLTQVILKRDSSLYISYGSSCKKRVFTAFDDKILSRKSFVSSHMGGGGGNWQNHPYVINEWPLRGKLGIDGAEGM